MINQQSLFASLGLAAFLAAAPSAPAAELGDPAKPLKIAEWVKGQPVDLAAGKGKNIYVVEFWATWCPPCRTSIPHLTELQKKFKDKGVVFIGISSERADTVKKFVEKLGDQMDYVVAIDAKDATSADYMEAYGVNGIPHAFVVDKQGKVVWHGHPMSDLEETLQQVVAGKFDMKLARKRGEARELLQEFYQLVSSGKDDAKADQLARRLEVLDKELGGIAPGEKFNPAEIRKSAKFHNLLQEYQRALMHSSDASKEAALAKELEAVAPPEFKLADFRKRFEFRRLLVEYYRGVTGEGDRAKIPELRKQIEAAESNDATLLNDFAWVLLTDERVEPRDTQLALKLAQAAYDASDGKEAGIADTYARALFDNGKVAEAIEFQKKAVELGKDSPKRSEFESTLKKYQAAPKAK